MNIPVDHIAIKAADSAAKRASSFFDERLCMRIPWDIELSHDGRYGALLLDGLLQIVDLSKPSDIKATKLPDYLCVDHKQRLLKWIESGLAVLDAADKVLTIFDTSCQILRTVPLQADGQLCVNMFNTGSNLLLACADTSTVTVRISDMAVSKGPKLLGAHEVEHAAYLPGKKLLVLIAHEHSHKPYASAMQDITVAVFSLSGKQMGSMTLPRQATKLSAKEGWNGTLQRFLGGAEYFLFPILDVVPSPDESTVLLLHGNGMVSVLALEPLRLLHTLDLQNQAPSDHNAIRGLCFMSTGLLAALTYDGQLLPFYLEQGVPRPAKARALPPALGLHRCRSVGNKLVFLRYVDSVTYNLFVLTQRSALDAILHNLRRNHINEALEIAYAVGQGEDFVYKTFYALVQDGSAGQPANEVLRLIADDAFVMKQAVLYAGPQHIKVVKEGLHRAMTALKALLNRCQDQQDLMFSAEEDEAMQWLELLYAKYKKLLFISLLVSQEERSAKAIQNQSASINMESIGSGTVDSKQLVSYLDSRKLTVADCTNDSFELNVLNKINLFIGDRSDGQHKDLSSVPMALLLEFCISSLQLTEFRYFLHIYAELQGEARLLGLFSLLPVSVDPSEYLPVMSSALDDYPSDLCCEAYNRLVEANILDSCSNEDIFYLCTLRTGDERTYSVLDEEAIEGIAAAYAVQLAEEPDDNSNALANHLIQRMKLLDEFGLVFYSQTVVDHLVSSTNAVFSEQGEMLAALQCKLAMFCRLAYSNAVDDDMTFIRWLNTSPEEKISMIVRNLLGSSSGDSIVTNLQDEALRVDVYLGTPVELDQLLHVQVNLHHHCLDKDEFEDLLVGAMVKYLEPYDRDNFSEVTSLLDHYSNSGSGVIFSSPVRLAKLILFAVIVHDDLDTAVRSLLPLLKNFIDIIHQQGSHIYNEFYVEQIFFLESLLVGCATIQHFNPVPPLSILCPQFAGKVLSHSSSDAVQPIVTKVSKLKILRFKKGLLDGCGYLGQTVLTLLNDQDFRQLFNNHDQQKASSGTGQSITDTLINKLNMSELIILKLANTFVHGEHDFVSYLTWFQLAGRFSVLNKNILFNDTCAHPIQSNYVATVLMVMFVHSFDGELVRNFLLFYYLRELNDTAGNDSMQHLPLFVDCLNCLMSDRSTIPRVLLVKVKDLLYTNPLLKESDLESVDDILSILSNQSDMDDHLKDIIATEKHFIKLFKYLLEHKIDFIPLKLRLDPPDEINGCILFRNIKFYQTILGSAWKVNDCSDLNKYLQMLTACGPTDNNYAMEILIMMSLIKCTIEAGDAHNTYLLVCIILHNYSLDAISGNCAEEVVQVLVQVIALFRQREQQLDKVLFDRMAALTRSDGAFPPNLMIWQHVYGLCMSKCSGDQLDLLISKCSPDGSNVHVRDVSNGFDAISSIVNGNKQQGCLPTECHKYEALHHFVHHCDEGGEANYQSIMIRLKRMSDEMENELSAQVAASGSNPSSSALNRKPMTTEQIEAVRKLTASGYSEIGSKKCVQHAIDAGQGRDVYKSALLYAIDHSNEEGFDQLTVNTEFGAEAFYHPQRAKEYLSLQMSIDDIRDVQQMLQQLYHPEQTSADGHGSSSSKSASKQRMIDKKSNKSTKAPRAVKIAETEGAIEEKSTGSALPSPVPVEPAFRSAVQGSPKGVSPVVSSGKASDGWDDWGDEEPESLPASVATAANASISPHPTGTGSIVISPFSAGEDSTDYEIDTTLNEDTIGEDIDLMQRKAFCREHGIPEDYYEHMHGMLTQVNEYVDIALPVDTMVEQLYLLQNQQEISEESAECINILNRLVTLLIMDVDGEDTFAYLQSQLLTHLHVRVADALFESVLADKFDVNSVEGEEAIRCTQFLRDLLNDSNSKLLTALALWRLETLLCKDKSADSALLDLLHGQPMVQLVGLSIFYLSTDDSDVSKLSNVKKQAHDTLIGMHFDSKCKEQLAAFLQRNESSEAVYTSVTKQLSDDLVLLGRLDRIAHGKFSDANIKAFLQSDGLLTHKPDRLLAIAELMRQLNGENILHYYTALTKQLDLTKAEVYLLHAIKLVHIYSDGYDELLADVIKCMDKVKEWALKMLLLCAICGVTPDGPVAALGQHPALPVPQEYFSNTLPCHQRCLLLGAVEEHMRGQPKMSQLLVVNGESNPQDVKCAVAANPPSIIPYMVHLAKEKARIQDKLDGLLLPNSIHQEVSSVLKQCIMREAVDNGTVQGLLRYVSMQAACFSSVRLCDIGELLKDAWCELSDRLSQQDCKWDAFQELLGQCMLLVKRRCVLPSSDQEEYINSIATILRSFRSTQMATLIGSAFCWTMLSEDPALQWHELAFDFAVKYHICACPGGGAASHDADTAAQLRAVLASCSGMPAEQQLMVVGQVLRPLIKLTTLRAMDNHLLEHIQQASLSAVHASKYGEIADCTRIRAADQMAADHAVAGSLLANFYSNCIVSFRAVKYSASVHAPVDLAVLVQTAELLAANQAYNELAEVLLVDVPIAIHANLLHDVAVGELDVAKVLVSLRAGNQANEVSL